MKCILALDQGTSSSRAIVFDREGQELGKGQYEITQYFPKSGWVEHDAEEIWRTQLLAVKDAIRLAGVSYADIEGIGITNQRETVVVWDRKSGDSLAPAIVWQDRRTARFCHDERDKWEKIVRDRTGLLLDPYFSGTKIKWLLDELPGLRERAEVGEIAIGTIESWLVWKLTGGDVHVTDVSNASRTMLMNVDTLEWDPLLLEWLKIPRSVLPKIVSNSEQVGTTKVFGGELPITGLAGDQQAALFGQLCFEGGMLKTTYGTGCFLLMQTSRTRITSKNRLLSTVAWKLGDSDCQYALEGSVFSGGAVVQWLKEGLGLIEKPVDIEVLAKKEKDHGGVYFAPAFTGLGAPHWDPYARGVIAGLTRGTTAGHIAWAALESIAFQVDDIVRLMKEDAGIDSLEMRVDGGASESDLLLQIQSDFLGCRIVRGATSETTARGVAFLAGLAVGFWKDQSELVEMWEEVDRFEPSMDLDWFTERRKGWEEVVRRSMGWARQEE